MAQPYLPLPFFGTGMKTDLFQSCGHWWFLQICCHIEFNTFTLSALMFFNSLGHIPRSGITGSYSNFIFNFLRICHSVFQGFPISSTGKELACNAGDPGLGRAPGEGLGYPLQYFWAFLVAQMVNNLPSMWDTWVWSLCWKDPLEKGKASHSSIMAWRISDCIVHGVTESDTTERLSLTHLLILFSTVAVSIYNPNNSAQGFLFFHIHSLLSFGFWW